MATILHITTRAAWDEARSAGVYTAASLNDVGFIHFSTREQTAQTANRFYHGQPGLVLLVVDTERLTAPLKWEAPAHPTGDDAGQKFPHLYGTLNLDAVTSVVDFPPQADGTFQLPL